MPRVLVGISGYAGVGKDEARNVLCAEAGYVGAAFAEKLRQLALFLNPFFPEANDTYRNLIERLTYDTAKRQYPCIREYLIKLGDGGRRILYPEIWRDSVLPLSTSSAYPEFMANPQPLVISDIRYANESTRITELGGFVIRISRPGCTAVHETEAKSLAETPYDVEIINDGTLEEFRAKVLDAVKHLRNYSIFPGGSFGNRSQCRRGLSPNRSVPSSCLTGSPLRPLRRLSPPNPRRNDRGCA
jgi:hypothetical protein